MPTVKPRVTIVMSEELLKQVDNYRFSHRIKNQSQAIAQLIAKGIEVVTGETVNIPERMDLSKQEREIVEAYRSANNEGKELFHKVVGVSNAIYKNADISDMETAAM